MDAEQFLKSKLDYKLILANNRDYTFNKIIEAMQEYAQHLLSEKEAEIKRLTDWKESASDILRTIDLQECSKVMNLQPGSDIAKHILPALKELEEINRLERKYKPS